MFTIRMDLAAVRAPEAFAGIWPKLFKFYLQLDRFRSGSLMVLSGVLLAPLSPTCATDIMMAAGANELISNYKYEVTYFTLRV